VVGIGDTIGVLVCHPVESQMGFEILQILGLRHRGVNIISCPSCQRRQGFDRDQDGEAYGDALEHIKTPMSHVDYSWPLRERPGEALMTDGASPGGGQRCGDWSIWAGNKPIS